MKINTNHEITDFFGSVVPDMTGIPPAQARAMAEAGENFPPMTLGVLCIRALLAQYPDEQSLGVERKLERHTLAKKIQAGHGEIDLKVEEVVMIKSLVGRAYSTEIVGAAFDLIDPVID